LNLISEPYLKFRGTHSLRLTSDDGDIDGIFQPVKWLGEIPGMGVTVTSRRKILDSECSQFPRFSPEIRNIDNDQFSGLLRIKKSKDEMRTTEARIFGFDIVGKGDMGERFHYGRTESVIGKERISTPCNHNLGIQHARDLT